MGLNLGSGTVTCGNGIVDGNEACDGSALGGLACANFGFSSGTLACSNTCELEKSHCQAGSCTSECSGRMCGADPACGASCCTYPGESCDSSGQRGGTQPSGPGTTTCGPSCSTTSCAGLSCVHSSWSTTEHTSYNTTAVHNGCP